MKEMISIKYGIQLLGQKLYIWDIKFKIYYISKSIPAAKSQNFVDISSTQNPTWAKFLEFNFVLPEKTRLCRHHQNKNQLEMKLNEIYSF